MPRRGARRNTGLCAHRHRLAAACRLEVLERRPTLGEIERLAVEITQAVLRRGGAGKQIPLRISAAKLTKFLELLPALDAFGDHLDVQMARHGDDGTHDGEVAQVGHQVAHEGAVDLEGVDAPALQVGEARVPGAEIVNGNVYTELAQPRDRILA